MLMNCFVQFERLNFQKYAKFKLKIIHLPEKL